MIEVDVAEIDCIYLTYDEPRADEFWSIIQNNVPWAKRVHGVEGSDAAHKAAAEASDTERFILIDGDNLPDWSFFDEVMVIPDEMQDCVFRWKARNHINGLMYGNGGLSCWTREFVRNMRTHEASDGRDVNNVEFCFDPRYIAMHNVYSTTYPNGSEKHAFRAGFREGVKMCLDQGKRLSVIEFNDRIERENMSRLLAWLYLGRDVEHGEFAIAGAQRGVYQTMLTDWDHRNVQNFKKVDEQFEEFMDTRLNVGPHLERQLGIDNITVSEAESRLTKNLIQGMHYNFNVMTTERAVLSGSIK